MLASLALALLQEEPAPIEPPAAESSVQAAPLEALVPGTLLGALEEELITLHRRLRPALVAVRMPVLLRNDAGELVPSEALVSGVVVDGGGLFVAPELLADGPARVRVERFDGREFPASVVARDETYGLTLFRAPELGLPPPPIGMCDTLRVGSVTITIGNAFGLDGSLGMGHLAGRQRRVGKSQDLLQITNPVNRGDGGGLVANRRGEVVGVLLTSLREAARRRAEKTGLQDREGMLASESIGFAVPIDRVLMSFAPYLSRPWPKRPELGITITQQLDPERARRIGLGDGTTLVVQEVRPGTAAAQAGILPGDVLVNLAGNPLHSLDCLRYALAVSDPTVDLTLYREGRRQVLRVTLEALGGAAVPPPPDPGEDER